MKVFLGESDMAVGGLQVYSRLIVFGEPTIPYTYFETPTSRYVPCAKPYGRTGIIFRVLTFPVRLCYAIVFLTVTATAWLLAIRAKITESERYAHIASCCYLLWSVAGGMPVPKMPQIPQLSIYFNTINKMHRYTMVFITINYLHNSGGISANTRSSKLY